MFYVYILRCADDFLYIGHTGNIKRRLATHNAGRGPAFTSLRRPVTLVFVESHATKATAVRRERQLKRWSRKKKEALIRGDVKSLRILSKRRT